MELEFIQWLRQRPHQNRAIKVGPGDDAAVLALPRGDCVVTVDTLMEGVHFDLNSCTPQQVGHKALAVNLSDLAAMAADPVAAVLSLSLPQQSAAALARGVFEGCADLATRYDVAIAGGDTNTWEGPLVVAVTALGVVQGEALKRSGARVGDDLVVTGELGGSLLGKHLDFEPRLDIIRELRSQFTVHAGTDISDGLSLDVRHLCVESGCGAEVDLAAIPISAAAQKLSETSDKTPLQHALSDGEDFELLLAMPPDTWNDFVWPNSVPLGGRTKLTRIGRFVAQHGLFQITSSGAREPLPADGYEHQ